jgi:hypothetical protein
MTTRSHLCWWVLIYAWAKIKMGVVALYWAGLEWHNLGARLYGQNILKYSDWDFEEPENLLSSGIPFRPAVFLFHLPSHYHYWTMAYQLSFLHLFYTVVFFVDTGRVVWQVATIVSEISIRDTLSPSYSEYESSLPRKRKIPFSVSSTLQPTNIPPASLRTLSLKSFSKQLCHTRS